MRILIVEDNKTVRTALSRYLKEEAFAVDACASGQEGTYLAAINEYDLIVLDCMLPDKDGFDVCREIRSRGNDMPILILSAVSTSENKIRLLNAGADDYVTKPFSFEEVCAHIRALLRRPGILTPSVIKVGHLTIDPGRQKVFCGNREVYLTRKEFSVLEYLALHPDHVVSRGMLIEHVWNMDADPFSNTLEVHIFNIRKKTAHKEGTLIHTVPGRGYRLSAAL